MLTDGRYTHAGRGPTNRLFFLGIIKPCPSRCTGVPRVHVLHVGIKQQHGGGDAASHTQRMLGGRNPRNSPGLRDVKLFSALKLETCRVRRTTKASGSASCPVTGPQSQQTTAHRSGLAHLFRIAHELIMVFLPQQIKRTKIFCDT